VNSLFELQIQPYKAMVLPSFPSEGIVKNLNFDGKGHAYERPDVKAKFASSISRVDALTLEMTEKFNGKLADTEEIRLSPDHDILTITIRSVGQSRPEIRVFDRE
jgi:hypothetical protein